MRWEDERESGNVEDVRGESGGGGFGGGFGGGGMGSLLGLLPLLLSGRGGIVALLFVAAVIFGGPLLSRMGQGGGEATPQQAPSGYHGGPGQAPGAPGEDTDLRFVRKVVAYTEDTWGEIFQQQGRTYVPPKVKVYTAQYATGCGEGSAEMGPFYCPSDRTVYLDLAFFQELSQRFGAPGRFAQAYVVAHEVGHHVQNLLGTMDRRGASGFSGSKNQTSVRTELQADCYAGIWAAQTNRDRRFLDPGDIDQGLAAATAVGDDTLQRQATGRVVPDSFTHGSSAQRVKWFKRGYDGDDLQACDTFSEPYGEL